jgi:protein-S-isoprenylcysteine O-methyltransferase Ste14
VTVAALALALYLLFILIAFGLRIAIQVRRTGSSGVHRLSGPPGSAEWLAGVGFLLALVLGFAAPLVALLGIADPISALDATAAHLAGVALALAGIGATFLAQLAMGASWRVGVDPAERTALVTDGPFALVRNPIFSAMLPATFGLVLLVPSWIALLAFAGLLAAIELQVRAVEEPHLLRIHGAVYSDYARRVGRFVPALGKLRALREGTD